MDKFSEELAAAVRMELGVIKKSISKNRVYISGKITGLTEKEALELFNEAETKLKKQGFEVVNPMTIPHEHGKTWVEYMREDLKAMLTCDTVFMLTNWQQSKGATIERNLALTLDFNIIYQ
jgi:Asp-tRNA(Asn)/Glu-tRNA(Gln) amidotransferase A subunit family amidase